jgi:hypothetical protein
VKTQPFGLALWGVENVLGYMDGEIWHYFSNYEQLEKLFRTTLEDELVLG